MPDGSKYVGGVKDGKKHGRGFLFLADGRITVCVYKAAKFITQSRKPEDSEVISYSDYQLVTTRSGETVSDIAIRLGLDPIKLALTNGFKLNKRLRAGNLLILPRDVWIGERTPNNQNSTCSGANAHNVAINLKYQFSALPNSQRKTVQSNLKRTGLYTSSIDGKWGRGTLMALVEFSSKNLGTVDLQSAAASKKLLDAVLR